MKLFCGQINGTQVTKPALCPGRAGTAFTHLTPVFLGHLLAPLVGAPPPGLVELRVGGSFIGVDVDVAWTQTGAALEHRPRPYRRSQPCPTCRKPSSKENVEELLWGNVGLEISVEGPTEPRASAAGLFSRAKSCRLLSALIVLLPLLGVAQHGVRVADCCGRWLGTRQRRFRLIQMYRVLDSTAFTNVLDLKSFHLPKRECRGNTLNDPFA